MKKVKLLVFSILIVIVTILSVNAADLILVPVNESYNSNQGSVNSFEHYTYDLTQLYKQDNNLFFYTNVKNNTRKVQPICLEVLLFDKNENNIGIFNYSSLKDYESVYASKKLEAGEKISFNYMIIDKYLADKEENRISDIAYYSIISDNEYCKVGGYDKYKGQSFKSIVDSQGKVTTGTKFDSIVIFINRYIPIDGINVGFGVGVIVFIVVIVIFLAIWITFGAFLNKLHRAMFHKTTALAYIPIANSFLCVRMAFGKIIGLIYLGVTIFGSVVGMLGLTFISIIANLIFIVAFVIDIIKLITGKYDLCYLDKSNTSFIYDVSNNNLQNQTNEYGYSQDNNVKESLIGIDNSNTLDDDTSNVSLGVNTDNMSSDSTIDNQSNDNSDESDLSRFFR